MIIFLMHFLFAQIPSSANGTNLYQNPPINIESYSNCTISTFGGSYSWKTVSISILSGIEVKIETNMLVTSNTLVQCDEGTIELNMCPYSSNLRLTTDYSVEILHENQIVYTEAFSRVGESDGDSHTFAFHPSNKILGEIKAKPQSLVVRISVKKIETDLSRCISTLKREKEAKVRKESEESAEKERIEKQREGVITERVNESEGNINSKNTYSPPGPSGNDIKSKQNTDYQYTKSKREIRNERNVAVAAAVAPMIASMANNGAFDKLLEVSMNLIGTGVMVGSTMLFTALSIPNLILTPIWKYDEKFWTFKLENQGILEFAGINRKSDWSISIGRFSRVEKFVQGFDVGVGNYVGDLNNGPIDVFYFTGSYYLGYAFSDISWLLAGAWFKREGVNFDSERDGMKFNSVGAGFILRKKIDSDIDIGVKLYANCYPEENSMFQNMQIGIGIQLEYRFGDDKIGYTIYPFKYLAHASALIVPEVWGVSTGKATGTLKDIFETDLGAPNAPSVGDKEFPDGIRTSSIAQNQGPSDSDDGKAPDDTARPKRPTPAKDSGTEPVAKLTQPRLDEVQKLIGEAKWEEALAATEKELTVHPGHANLLFFQGLAQFKLEKFDEALASFLQVQKTGVVSLELTISLSETLFYLKKLDECEKVLREGMLKFPKAAALWYNLGGIHAEKKDPENAKKMYAEALLRDKEFGPALYSMADLYASEKAFDKATELLDKLTQQDKYKEIAHTKLAIVLSYQKKWDEALAHVAQLEKLNVGSSKVLRDKILGARAFSELGELIKAKKCKEAKAHFEIIKKDFPTSAALSKAQDLLSRKCPR